MRAVDSNGDGVIPYMDLIAFLIPVEAKAAGPAAGRARPTTDEPRKPALKLSDRVSSELRSKFDAAISSGKIRSYEDVFKAMDKDGNGTVSRREFEDGLADLRVSVSCHAAETW
jgi:hypothetical protein